MEAGRNIGINIYSLMQGNQISRDEFAKQMGYSFRDVCRLTEGRLLVSPTDLEKIAGILKTTKENIVNREADSSFPNLNYMKEFSDPDNWDKVMDLLDEYIALVEAV